ncbi:hypothetical protein D9M69_670600 [compost metagenome]
MAVLDCQRYRHADSGQFHLHAAAMLEVDLAGVGARRRHGDAGDDLVRRDGGLADAGDEVLDAQLARA